MLTHVRICSPGHLFDFFFLSAFVFIQLPCCLDVDFSHVMDAMCFSDARIQKYVCLLLGYEGVRSS